MKFYTFCTQGYNGLRHAVRLAAAVRLGAQSLEVSGLLTRTLALAPERSSLESGAEVRWRAQVLAPLELEVALGARWRGFDVVDPDLGVIREELQLDGQLRADFELSDHLAIFIGLDARRVIANTASLTYSRLGASAGVRFSLGAW